MSVSCLSCCLAMCSVDTNTWKPMNLFSFGSCTRTSTGPVIKLLTYHREAINSSSIGRTQCNTGTVHQMRQSGNKAMKFSEPFKDKVNHAYIGTTAAG